MPDTATLTRSTISALEMEEMAAFEAIIELRQFRSPVLEDLSAGKVLFIVEVHTFMLAYQRNESTTAGWTQIQLATNPIRMLEFELQEMVYHFCIDPPLEPSSRLLKDVLRSGCDPDPYNNRYRWVIPIRA